MSTSTSTHKTNVLEYEYEKNVIVRSNREYDYFGNVLEYDYFPSYSNTSTKQIPRTQVRVHDYDYSISDVSHIIAQHSERVNLESNNRCLYFL